MKRNAPGHDCPRDGMDSIDSGMGPEAPGEHALRQSVYLLLRGTEL